MRYLIFGLVGLTLNAGSAWAACGFAASKTDVPEALRDIVDRAKQENSTSLIVIQDGKILVEEYFGHDGRQPTPLMSVTKSVVALAFDGAKLDQPLSVDVLPEWADAPQASITLRHLLEHRSGLSTERAQKSEGDWSEVSIEDHVMKGELAGKVGWGFAYNNNATDFLSVVARRLSEDNVPLDTQLQSGLF